jgi:pSer/pThr/pTyr-binding forkhead associated (FHA) protein
MAKLLLGFNDETLSEYDLAQEIMTIGRKSDNDIHIDNLAVSGHHAKILTVLNDSFIEDLGSTNGTFINGEKINKHALQNGEVILIGKHTLTYLNDAADAGTADFEKTVIVRPDAEGMPAEQVESNQQLEESIGRIASDLATDNASAAEETGIARIKFHSGANKGRELRLRKNLTTLGKPGLQVAAITRRPTGYFLIVVDASSSSTNPMVNGAEVGKQAHPLNSGDKIEVAGIKMEFALE